MRNLFAMIIIVLIGVFSALGANAKGVYAKSQHFELFADTEIDAATVLSDLETLRDVVLIDLGLSPDVKTEPLRITLTKDLETFTLITPSGLTAAAYLSTTISDDVILGRSDDPDHPLGRALDPRWLKLVLRHEAVHHLLDTHYPRKLPIWLGEGLAEYYATFDINPEGQVVFGRALPEQQTLPSSQPWLPMRTVIENIVTYPDFRESLGGDAYAAQQLYYGQTFALAHYIMDQPNGLARVHRFVDEWDTDIDSEESFRRAFGVRYAGLERNMRRDMAADTMSLRQFSAPLNTDNRLTIQPLTEEAMRANILRLVLTHGPASGRAAAKIANLEASAEGLSDDVSDEVDLARALMAWRWRDWDSADSTLSAILRETGISEDIKRRALKVRVKVAYGRLSQRQMDDGLWQAAEEAARKALNIDPSDAEMHMFRVAVSRPETVDLPEESKASLTWLTERNIHLRRPMTAMMTVPALLYEQRFDEADQVLNSAERWLSDPADQAVISLYRNNVRQSRERSKQPSSRN